MLISLLVKQQKNIGVNTQQWARIYYYIRRCWKPLSTQAQYSISQMI